MLDKIKEKISEYKEKLDRTIFKVKLKMGNFSGAYKTAVDSDLEDCQEEVFSWLGGMPDSITEEMPEDKGEILRRELTNLGDEIMSEVIDDPAYLPHTPFMLESYKIACNTEKLIGAGLALEEKLNSVSEKLVKHGEDLTDDYFMFYTSCYGFLKMYSEEAFEIVDEMPDKGDYINELPDELSELKDDLEDFRENIVQESIEERVRRISKERGKEEYEIDLTEIETTGDEYWDW